MFVCVVQGFCEKSIILSAYLILVEQTINTIHLVEFQIFEKLSQTCIDLTYMYTVICTDQTEKIYFSKIVRLEICWFAVSPLAHYTRQWTDTAEKRLSFTFSKGNKEGCLKTVTLSFQCFQSLALKKGDVDETMLCVSVCVCVCPSQAIPQKLFKSS